MTEGVVQLQTTLPDEPSARRLAEAVVAERLAACVQFVGPIRSVYRWEGRVEESIEWLCLIKTTTGQVAALQDRIRSLHTYTVPELVVLPVIGGDPGYLAWVRASVSGAESKA